MTTTHYKIEALATRLQLWVTVDSTRHPTRDGAVRVARGLSCGQRLRVVEVTEQVVWEQAEKEGAAC